MYDARTIANEFIHLANEAKQPLTNMQIQKLVYIAHGYSLAILNQPLIKQSVEAWAYGPVIPDLYRALRKYGSGVVREPIEKLPKETLSETDQVLIKTVLNAYGRFSGPQLSTMTHRENTPWKEVYNPHAFFNNNHIDDTLTKNHYKKLLDERARIQPV